MSLLQSAALLRSYFLLPQRLLNRSFARLVVRQQPRWAVRAAIALWIRRDRIDMADFAPGPFDSLEAFFLRRLRPGVRPLAAGFVSPVDGQLLAAGRLDGAAQQLLVKGRRMAVARVVNGRGLHALPLDGYRGGQYAVVFLSPRGYHRIHMPVDARIVGWQWLPGRFFPQNERALARIAGVYERNERLVLRCRRSTGGGEFLLVLVGASLVGGIVVHGIDLGAARGGRVLSGDCSLPRRKGEELGYFRFGSTVVTLLPGGAGGALPALGSNLRMGEPLFDF